jgi:hypothetical protein
VPTTTSTATTTTTFTVSTTTTTLPAEPCAPLPAAGCRLAAPAAAQLQIWDDADDTRDRLKWRWSRGAATPMTDFMNPPGGAASYDVCIYDSSRVAQPLMAARIPGGGRCGAKPCWKSIRAVGYRYGNRAGGPRGITKARLQAGGAGKAQARVSGKGVNLPTPAPALTLPVTVQLVVTDGSEMHCWQTTYTTAIVNAPGRFRAKGP